MQPAEPSVAPIHTPAARPARRHALNHLARRQLAKAERCIRRSTKIPARILRDLAIVDAGLLPRLADAHGKRIGELGSVLPKPPSPTPGSSAGEGDTLTPASLEHCLEVLDRAAA